MLTWIVALIAILANVISIMVSAKEVASDIRNGIRETKETKEANTPEEENPKIIYI